MSEVHVLQSSTGGGDTVSKRYAFHITIPVPDQVVEAAQDPMLVAFVSAVPDITTLESDAIKAGEIVEYVLAMDYFKDELNAPIQARVRAKFTALEPIVIARYKEKYRQYLTGFDV